MACLPHFKSVVGVQTMPTVSTMCAVKARMQGPGKQTVDTQASPTERDVECRKTSRGLFSSVIRSRKKKQ